MPEPQADAGYQDRQKEQEKERRFQMKRQKKRERPQAVTKK